MRPTGVASIHGARLIRGHALALATVLAASTLGARAATEVTVRVVDPDGKALADVLVAVRLVESRTSGVAASHYFAYIAPRKTDLNGQATFPGLIPGIYATSITGLSDAYLMPPSSPGSDSLQGQFTVRDESRLTVPIVLTRGSEVDVDVVSDIPEDPPYSFAFVEVVTGVRVARTLRQATKATLMLPVGRWRVEFAPPLGLVFRSLEIDGVTAPLASATLDIDEGGQRRFVTLTFSGPCFIRAHVASVGASGDLPSLIAKLTAPGPLTTAATSVGAPPLDPMWIPEEFALPTYDGWLPDGVWRITPTSDGLESSDPPFIDVDCTATPQHALEFEVRISDDGGGRKRPEGKLVVTVKDADDNDLDGAFVEVYSKDGMAQGDEPLTRRRTSADYPGGPVKATFTGLPLDPLVVVAGHEKGIDASVSVPARDPNAQDQRWRQAAVRLGAGASIEVDALKPGDAPASGAVLKLDRDDRDAGVARVAAGASPRIKDPVLRALKAHRSARTDASGRAEIRAVEPGSYLAKASYGGSSDASYLVQVRESASEPVDTLPVHIAGTERKRLTIVFRKAASMIAALSCDDRGGLPLKIDARLLPAYRDAAWRTTLPLGELVDPLYKLGGLPLGGAESNRLRLGPLTPGSYGLAIRPQGFDRWSFAGGGDDPSRAMTLQLQEGQELDLGNWEIPCRPSILLVPRLVDDGTTPPPPDPKRQPDVSHATVTSTIAASSVRVDSDSAKRNSYRRPDSIPILRAMRLYGVPNEPITFGLQVRDRYLLPEKLSPAPNPLVLDLDRGRENVVQLQFEALAGTIDIAADAPAARAIFADGTITMIPHDGTTGLLRAGPLRPGLYTVEVCADADCSNVARRFDGVTVKALSLTVLPPGN